MPLCEVHSAFSYPEEVNMSFDIQHLPLPQHWGLIWAGDLQRLDANCARRALLRRLRERVLQLMGADLELLARDTSFSGSSIGLEVLKAIDLLNFIHPE